MVFAAAGARHTAISPESSEHRLVSRFCDSVGVPTDQLTFVEGYSEQVLPSYSPPGPLDLVFIDGKHSFPYPVLDWHFLGRHLRVGGTMLLDDVQAIAVQVLSRIMLADEAWQFEAALGGEAIAFKKLREPSPEDRWLDQEMASLGELERLAAT